MTSEDGGTGRAYALRGERVALGKLRREDVAGMTAWFQNLEYTTYLGRPGMLLTVEEELEWFERNARNTPEQVQFGIFELGAGRHVGNCGLFSINAQHGTATLGIGIGVPDAWGRGYGTEAVGLLVQYGMFFLNLEHVRLYHVAFNERGHRAYQKAGFRVAGRLTGTIALGGERFDEVIMEVRREDVDLGPMRAKLALLPPRG